jgi:hypothetical protein
MNVIRARRLAVSAVLCLFAACGGGSSTPAAPPTPAPTPTPTVVATPRPFACPLPALPDTGVTCPKIAPVLSGYVNTAVENVAAQRPELFDFNDNLGPGSWKVKDRRQYVDAVIEAIHAQGICAEDDNEEIQLKNTNDFNEQYNIWTSGGYVRRSYITTCFPAQF